VQVHNDEDKDAGWFNAINQAVRESWREQAPQVPANGSPSLWIFGQPVSRFPKRQLEDGPEIFRLRFVVLGS
jgi:hypothetical protein